MASDRNNERTDTEAEGIPRTKRTWKACHFDLLRRPRPVLSCSKGGS